MKKNYNFLIAALLLFAMTVSAQQISTVNQPTVPAGKVFDQPLPFKANFHPPQQHKAVNANTERWYNFGETMDLYHNVYLGDSSALYGNYLFPDSTVLVDYGASGYAGTWIHMLGDMFDVRSGYFNDNVLYTDPNELFLTATDPYYLDSLDFYFIYSRMNTSVTDSLIFEVAVNNTMGNSYFLAPVAANLGVDTCWIKNVPYIYTSNVLNLAGKRRFAFPLDDALFADSTANGFHHIAFSTIGIVPQIQAGKLIMTGIQFKPGYTWTQNVDTLASMNSVRFISYKQNPGNNPPTTFGFPTITKKDYNIAHIVPQDVRYNVAGGWNGLFIPSYAYMGSVATYSYEHHLLYYKVNTLLVGYNEIAKNNTVISHISPNPVSGISAFSYKLEAAENVDVIITDINGRVVRIMNEGTQSAGYHTVKVDGSTLAAGLYSYTLKTKTVSATGKMSVAR